ncbi:growth hormone-regulated TBC protein 1 [Panicum miliaceum]|uniref:Growth hormone-regulated TBC protein 1 n=1 Tax=Panicum miliaceum TaxID=4540 RepID=A0A3L6PP87_PANMI|nr:growth hormone-regulated TBC protein 1 [Panicum miliaceum]
MPATTHTIRYNTGKKSLFNARLMSVKFEDLYGFMVEGNVDDVNVLNEVRERIREHGRVWWALEANKGANWYLQPKISSNEGVISVTSLKLSVLTNTITLRRLIRKGVPPVLRPKVWLSVSGAAKKRSTVPETYYDELIRATEGKTTPATRQIDHDLPRTFPCHPWLNSEEGQASLRRVLVGYSFRDSEVGYCQARQEFFV